MRNIFVIMIVLGLGIPTGCKGDFLDVKPRKSLLVPTSLEEVQALFDNIQLMNVRPALCDIATGEFLLPDAAINRLSSVPERGIYQLDVDPYQGAPVSDWDRPYEQIFYANVALEALDKMSEVDKQKNAWKNLHGAALFFRASALFYLSQAFCRPYLSETANQEMGVPVPLSSNVNIRHSRGTLAGVYEQIVLDMEAAEQLLDKSTNIKSRPSQPAAWAMLAKIYLAKADYTKAERFADLVLKSRFRLLDFNQFKTGSFMVFPEILPNGNDEVIMFVSTIAYSFFSNNQKTVDPQLLGLYAPADLRKGHLFYHTATGVAYFSGYTGLTVGEMYLIDAECRIRRNDIQGGLDKINSLLRMRFRTGAYSDVTGLSKQAAMELVLQERKKELVWRGTRWYDLKRLNAEGLYVETLKRTVNGISHTLAPDDRRYVFPIPDDELRGNGIPQN